MENQKLVSRQVVVAAIAAFGLKPLRATSAKALVSYYYDSIFGASIVVIKMASADGGRREKWLSDAPTGYTCLVNRRQLAEFIEEVFGLA